jgi:cytidyltransferase-like protein
MYDKEKRKTIMVSGGFDPVHIGHIRMIIEASKHGDVIVVANSDDWLYRKKGFVFMEFDQRAEILAAIKGVIKVSGVDDYDGTVCEAIRAVKQLGLTSLIILQMEATEKSITLLNKRFVKNWVLKCFGV